MKLIPEQVKFLREAIAGLEHSQNEFDDYLSDRDNSRCIEDIEINVTDSITEYKISQQQEQLREYRELLTHSDYMKTVSKDKIGIGTKFKIKFDGEETDEEFILVDSIIGSNLSSEAITIE
ncbi:MAG: hypothetical protein K2I72_00445, partial [Bacilli bacterium]|nr:hypothetical protein [Bacilli bacterium]